ncbi:MAG: hypothetical protein AABY18_06485 [Candidatus Thermoplasmatota archaeon]
MATTLFDIVEAYRRRGLATPFAVRPAGHVLCGSCRRENPAGLVRLLALDRPAHEVAPGERLAVAALQCTSCDVRGTLPLTYGPCAAPDEDLVFALFDHAAIDLAPDASFA